VTFSTRGGRVTAVRLNKYKTFFGQPLDLLDAQSARLDTRFRTLDGKTVRFSDLNFQPEPVLGPANKRGGGAIRFKASVAGGEIVQTYTVPSANSYEIEYDLRFNGLQNVVAQEPLVFTFNDRVRQTEQDLKQNRNHSTINHYLAVGDHGALAEASETPETSAAGGPVRWAAHKHDFFVAGLIADKEPFSGGNFQSSVDQKDSTFIKTMGTSLSIPVAEVLQGRGQYRFYFGPNDFSTLKAVAPEFDRNVYLGWGLFRYVNQFVVLPVFHFLQQYISSYGIIIAAAGGAHQARDLAADLQDLRKPGPHESAEARARPAQGKVRRRPDEGAAGNHEALPDLRRVAPERLRTYAAHAADSVCHVPVLSQRHRAAPAVLPLGQRPEQLRRIHQAALLRAFQWYGNHVSLFTLLMTASTLLMTWQSNQMNTAMQGPMKFYSYLMPIIFLFVLNSFAAGLTWYYFVSNVVTFGQQALTKAFVDEKKIRAKLEVNKVKNKDKKPGGFQARLAEAMKAAQEKETQAKKK
jgi:YidC/Oxa1 family membrane protein insertase